MRHGHRRDEREQKWPEAPGAGHHAAFVDRANNRRIVLGPSGCPQARQLDEVNQYNPALAAHRGTLPNRFERP